MIKYILFEKLFPSIAERYYDNIYNLQEAEDTILKYKKMTDKYQKDDETLWICPNVRGHRYYRIVEPKWFQTKDLEQLGRDMANYMYSEAIPTKRLKVNT